MSVLITRRFYFLIYQSPFLMLTHILHTVQNRLFITSGQCKYFLSERQRTPSAPFINIRICVPHFRPKVASPFSLEPKISNLDCNLI